MAKNLFQVKEINLYIQGLLADDDLLQNLWIEGEISNFKQHSSGHWYFTLKGDGATLKCVVFRQWTKGVFFLPEDGMEVRVRGTIAVYERDGQYILYGEEIAAVGTSNQYALFCALKERLYEEGLFAEERKRPLPLYPQKIAVVTSADGAAWHDMQKIFTQKIPAEVILFPCAVQGAGSEESIVRAIETVNSRKDIDVLIVSRGGGSKEDLAVFNTEGVTRAVAGSFIPVISAVGHEIDYTLMDLAADVRVPTPTAAASIVLPDKAIVQESLRAAKNKLIAVIEDFLGSQRVRLKDLSMACSLTTVLAQNQCRLQQVGKQLLLGIEKIQEEKNQRLQRCAAELSLINPLDVFARGYGMVSSERHGAPLKRAADAVENQPLFVEFVDGTVHCCVEKVTLTKRQEGK